MASAGAQCDHVNHVSTQLPYAITVAAVSFVSYLIAGFVPKAYISLPIALVLGVYDGFYGPGTGTFLLLLLTGVAHLPLNQAAGLTKAINLATNVAALTVFLRSGVSDLSLGLVAGCFGIAGNYLGSRLFVNKGAKWTKPLIVTVLVIFFCKVCYELVTGG